MQELTPRHKTHAASPLLSERFERAFLLASRLHARQFKKQSSVPYVSHLMGVAAIVLENGGDEEQAIAALLHDAAEDQGGRDTLAFIRREFGERVANIVDGCTDAYGEPKPPWRERKEKYLAHLPAADSDTRLVSLADKLHNARAIVAEQRTIGDRVFDRFRGGKEGTLWYYRSLADIFIRADGTPLAQELGRVVRQMEELAAGGEQRLSAD